MKSNTKKTTRSNNTKKTKNSGAATRGKRTLTPTEKRIQMPALLTPKTASTNATETDTKQGRQLGTRIDKMENLPSKATVFDTVYTHAMIYKRPINTLALAQELDVPPTKVSGLQKLVDQLVAEGILKVSPKGLLSPNSEHNIIKGKLQIHRDGYGFVITDSGEDVFVNERHINGAWHGDLVAVRIINEVRGNRREGKHSNKREGDIIEVIERKFSQVVGHLVNEHGVWLVRPDDVRLNTEILVDPSDLAGATADQIVVVALKNYGDAYQMPTGRIAEVLGDVDAPGMEIEIAVRKFDIPHQFSEATERQTAKLPDTVLPEDLAGRVDLRDVPLVTIDGEDARDFDDAVYCEPIKTGRKITAYRLIVAIADVSHYVRDRTPLNEDAVLRSTSVYFPRRVVPMLPEKLSNGLCSLNPAVDRLCMVADMVIDLEGQITAYQFYPAVMHSAARLTYTQVWEYLSENTGVLTQEYKAVAPHIKHLYALYQIQFQARAQRGAMEFETTETYIVSDENGKIKEILPRTRNDAHRLIEECMLAANVCAAEFIAQCERPSLYRVHEGPTPEKLEALRRNLMMFGLRMEGGDKPTPKDYAKLSAQIANRPDVQTIQTLLLRSMQQAVYSPENLGHFGLAYSAYTHFTSPIRRYPDLLVHRTIKAILQGQRYMPWVEGLNLLVDTRKKPLANDIRSFSGAAQTASKPKEQHAAHKKSDADQVWERLGEHTSMCERRADEASRDVTLWLKCEYMKPLVGETMQGKISSITAFGAFVTLNDVFIDGLIHISELGQDYFEYDEASYSLRGRSSGKIYRLGDDVLVRIANVDSETRKIDFVLESQLTEHTSKTKTTAKAPVKSAQKTGQKPKRAPSRAKRAQK